MDIIMNIRRAVLFIASILLCGLLFIYALFERDKEVHQTREEEKIKVRVLACYEIQQERELLKQLADDFNQKYQACMVEVEFIDKENLKKDICLRVDSGEQPDIVIGGSMEILGLADMGVLENVDSLVKENLYHKLIYPDMWQTTMNNGIYYGIPFICNPYVLFCNREYLKKLEKPAPHTWEEVLEICSKSSQKGVYGLSMGVKRSSDAATVFNYILYVSGANYYNLFSESGLGAIEIADILKRWGYVDKYCINSTPKDAAEVFREGQSVFLLAPLDTRIWLDHAQTAFKYEIVAAPEKIKSGYIISGDNLALLKGAKEEAFQFVEYLYTPQVRDRIVQGTGTLPIFQEEFKKYDNEGELRLLSDRFIRQGECLKHYNSWFEISDILSDSLRRLLTKRNFDLPQMAEVLQDKIRVVIMSN